MCERGRVCERGRPLHIEFLLKEDLGYLFCCLDDHEFRRQGLCPTQSPGGLRRGKYFGMTLRVSELMGEEPPVLGGGEGTEPGKRAEPSIFIGQYEVLG